MELKNILLDFLKQIDLKKYYRKKFITHLEIDFIPNLKMELDANSIRTVFNLKDLDLKNKGKNYRFFTLKLDNIDVVILIPEWDELDYSIKIMLLLYPSEKTLFKDLEWLIKKHNKALYNMYRRNVSRDVIECCDLNRYYSYHVLKGLFSSWSK